MEAKVDVRKLQLLNDRIAQTIDALNQVRMSVHGLGHTGQQSGAFGPQQNPWIQQGLGHSGVQGLGGIGQYTQQYGQQSYGQQVPWSSHVGLSHSPIDIRELQQLEQLASDPNRINQTFPFVFSPVGQGY